MKFIYRELFRKLFGCSGETPENSEEPKEPKKEEPEPPKNWATDCCPPRGPIFYIYGQIPFVPSPPFVDYEQNLSGFAESNRLTPTTFPRIRRSSLGPSSV